MIYLNPFEASCLRIRERNPLVHCITNYVSMEFNADALLAIGASPIMSFCKEEMEDISHIADSLVVNIGCLDSIQIESMKVAAAAYSKLGKKWVLDPVGAGATQLRKKTALMLIDKYKPSVIRGNASEIMALAGINFSSKGVDSLNDTSEAEEAAKSLALSSGAVVSVSGAIDIITDGTMVEKVEGGAPVMSRVTAMGCTASALTGAFLAVCPTAFEASVEAMMLMARAGESAAKSANGNASMRVAFVDALYHFYER